MKTRSYRDLVVWQKAMDLACTCYRLTSSYPPAERFGLVSQTRRAACSIPANIAEGYGRTHRGEYLQFLAVARGSLGELETHLILAVRLSVLSEDEAAAAFALCDEAGRMLRRMQQRLRAA